MQKIKKWALSYGSVRQMSSETGISRRVCEKLRTGEFDRIRVNTLQQVKSIYGILHARDKVLFFLGMFRRRNLTEPIKAVIKIMATAVVAKYKYTKCSRWKDNYRLTAKLAPVSGVSSFMVELENVERLLVNLYKRYPSRREELFEGTEFLELMKSLGKNKSRPYTRRQVNISPANSQCEP